MKLATVSKYMKQKLIVLEGKMEKFTIIAGDFNILLLVVVRTSRQKIHKDIVELNNTINQLHQIDIFPTRKACRWFSNTHWIFTKTDHILGSIANLKSFKGIKSIQCKFSGHNGIKLDINNKNITENIQILGN